jgi:hypothetical protein
MWLLAQATDSGSTSARIIDAVGHNGLWVMIIVCVIAGAGVDITKRILRHKERIAMIQAGLPPDSADRHG